jgi:hypothetical protein
VNKRGLLPSQNGPGMARISLEGEIRDLRIINSFMGTFE